MINLRYLNISSCKKLTHMPSEMGKLNRLEKLSAFIVDEERGCSIAQLQHLNIGGKLEVLKLGKLKDPRVAREVNLKDKHNIRNLYLYKNRMDDDEAVDDVAVDVLEGLEPPQSISELLMKGGIELPRWLKNITDASFQKLIDISLDGFKGCKHLPPFGQLQHLEKLEIYRMDSIEVIGREFCGSNRDAAFPSLKRIVFGNLPKWKKWLSSSSEEEEDEEDGIIEQQALAFPCLTELEIRYCPELTSLPRLPSLQMLTVEKSMKLLKSAGSLRRERIPQNIEHSW
ncbi:hypothetical protein QJS04_geneDACA015091 [Acorus gramineus]|uniref:R13L1/DRL21-like LRR repeat region domain-containing protein n=1 Tax=Acorus gramineus TaxID=55184 RepID=A0AAV9BV44_ACOGR|nr:hypothetical protein QJS04_geneDACA015091 [Acorus gramineus]